MMRPRQFIWEMFSENGCASFARVGTAVILFAEIGWVSYIVYTKGVIPDLSSASLFLLALYGAARASAAATQIAAKKADAAVQVSQVEAADKVSARKEARVDAKFEN